MKQRLLLQLLVLNCIFQITFSANFCAEPSNREFSIESLGSIDCVFGSNLTSYPSHSIEWTLLPSTIINVTTNSLNLSAQYLLPGVNQLECNFNLNETDTNSETITCPVDVTINSLPSLTISPTPDLIIYPSNTTLQCTAIGGFPTSTITWENPDGYTLSTNSTLSFNSNQSVIGDNLVFICIANNSVGVNTTNISITVRPDPPLVSIIPLPTPVFIGNKTTLNCTAISVLPSVTFDYTWYKDGTEISSSSLLTIVYTRTVNNGIYTCNATVLNSVNGTDNIKLTVTSPPPKVSITSSSPDNPLTFGSNVSLTCLVSPQPEDDLPITVVWLNSSLGMISGVNGTTLTLSSISLDYRGDYKCTATVGNSENVTAVYTLDVIPLAPAVMVISITSTPLIALIGQVVNLSCIVTDTSDSGASPNITWFNNQSIIAGETNKDYILGPVGLNDDSIYKCSASIDGSAFMDSNPFVITVYELPNITSIPISPQHVIEGVTTAALTCTASGTPNPSVIWRDKDGTMYTNPLDLSMLTNLMNGTFTCNATSLADESGVSDSIEIVIVPPAPSLEVITSAPNPVEDNIFTLNCSVLSRIPPGQDLSTYLFAWRLTNNLTVIQTIQNISFTADSATNGSQYECISTVAGSAEGNASSPILSLEREPNITNFYIPSTVYIGLSYSFTCEDNGIPEPVTSITNLKGDMLNTPADLGSFAEANVGTEVYIICSSENDHGKVSVNRTFEIKRPAITIVFTSDPIRVANGQSFVLNCSFTTAPVIPLDNTMFTFKMNQTVITTSQTVDPENKWATLTINSFSYGTDAQFSCFISIQGNTLTVEKTLNVQEVPISTPPEPLLFVAVAVTATAVILLLVFVCLILLLLMHCLRYRRKRDMVPSRTGDYIGLETPIADQSVFSYPISVSKYSETFDALHEDNQQKLKEQYQQLTSIKGSTEEAKKSANSLKNRYPDVLAYDHSRVIISKHQGTDYINANYMDGFGKSNAYIAAQGPLGPPKENVAATPSTSNGGAATPQLNTINDFWRMIWELNITTIVMLTNLIENNRVKCALYWPEDTKNYGRIRVRKVEENQFCDYIIRKFSIQRIQVHSADSETRQITQFHFVAWPDHGVPLFPIAMIQFVKLVRSYINQSGDDMSSPNLVHCSAGVGRTGTFICLDIILQQLATGDNIIDIWSETSKLRRRRNHMIQEYLQYEFVHQAINEHIQFGDTECSAANFPKMVTSLNEVTDDNPYRVGMSRLEVQFKKLQLRVIQSQHREAMLNENAGKNRFINTMPFDTNRVKLRPLPGIVGSDYINASYIDSDKSHWAFIATQGPLKTTMEDFCRMIVEKGTNVIILLSENSEDKTEDYFSFSQTHYGSYHFNTVKKHLHNDYIHREMVIRLNSDRDGHRVHHFQLTKLLSPSLSNKDCAKALLSLITGVTVTLQPEETNKGPMVVHCGGGNGMTGVFMTVYIIIERLLYEDKVDVFNTVKRLRMQRVAMVQSVDQYDLCHRAVMEYLQSSP